MYMDVCLNLSVNHVPAVPAEARGRSQSSWKWSYRRL